MVSKANISLAKSTRIYFDHQIFSLQKFGGISRYFVKLMCELDDSCGDCTINTNIKWSENNYLTGKKLPYFLPWKVRQLLYFILNSVSDIVHKPQNIDIYHPTYFGPNFAHLTNKKTVVTVFDMIHELSFITPSLLDTTIHDKFSIMKKADAIIAISHSTKNDLIKIYPEFAEKITVIYLASDFKICAKSLSNRSEQFILYVGNRSGYKNFWFYLSSIRQLLLKNNIALVAFGGGTFSSAESSLLHGLGLSELVTQVTGTDDDLINLYRSAKFLAYPSLIEGFGLPIIEAFTQGCPVLTSNLSSMKEIAGNAALLVNPRESYHLFTATNLLLSSKILRRKLSDLGSIRACKFSWQITAYQTKVLYKLLEENH